MIGEIIMINIRLNLNGETLLNFLSFWLRSGGHITINRVVVVIFRINRSEFEGEIENITESWFSQRHMATVRHKPEIDKSNEMFHLAICNRIHQMIVITWEQQPLTKPQKCSTIESMFFFWFCRTEHTPGISY